MIGRPPPADGHGDRKDYYIAMPLSSQIPTQSKHSDKTLLHTEQAGSLSEFAVLSQSTYASLVVAGAPVQRRRAPGVTRVVSGYFRLSPVQSIATHVAIAKYVRCCHTHQCSPRLY